MCLLALCLSPSQNYKVHISNQEVYEKHICILICIPNSYFPIAVQRRRDKGNLQSLCEFPAPQGDSTMVADTGASEGHFTMVADTGALRETPSWRQI